MRKGFIFLAAISVFAFTLSGCELFGSKQLPGNGDKAMLAGNGKTGSSRGSASSKAAQSARKGMSDDNGMTQDDEVDYHTTSTDSQKSSQSKKHAKRDCKRVKTSTGYTVKCKATNNNAL
jgi:hypothetical protein